MNANARATEAAAGMPLGAASTSVRPVPRQRSGPRRVLVTGSPTWVSATVIRDALAQVWGDGNTVLVTAGHPGGADRIAEMFWRRWGGQVERHKDWRLHQGSADVCLAFQRGPAGAANTVHLAESAGIPTRVYTHNTRRGAESDATSRPPAKPPAPVAQTERTPTDQATPDPPAPDESQRPRKAHATGGELPWQPDARDEPATAVEVATHYSYPEVAALVAPAAPGSDESRVAREALGLLMDQPELFAGGDQAREIARHLSAAEIERQRQIIGHGPLFEVLGRAAELQRRENNQAINHSNNAAPSNGELGHEEAVRRARWAVDALNQQARARRAAEWQSAGCPADWRPTVDDADQATTNDGAADAGAGRDDDPPALSYDGGQP